VLAFVTIVQGRLLVSPSVGQLLLFQNNRRVDHFLRPMMCYHYHECASTTLQNSQKKLICIPGPPGWEEEWIVGFVLGSYLTTFFPFSTHWVVGLVFAFCLNHSCIYGLQNFTGWGSSSKPRASPPRTGKDPFSLNLAARWRKSSCSQIILMDHFAVVILTPLKAFFYYGFGQSLLLVQM
jgi:hypothetical protein